MANKIKKIVPKGFITGEVKSNESLKAAKTAALSDTSIKRGERKDRGGTNKNTARTSTQKRDLSFLKQTYLLDNVEELILEQQKKKMLEDKSVQEAIIPYTPSSHQLEVHDLLEKKRFGVVVFHRGAGKKLSLSTDILRIQSANEEAPNPTWIKLFDLKEGDTIPGLRGCTKVTKLHPITTEKIYRVETKAGASIDACGEHLWVAARVPKKNCYYSLRLDGIKWETIDTKKLKAWADDGAYHTLLPKPDAVEFANRELPIDPYLFGLWLGMERVNAKRFHIKCKNADIVSWVTDELNGLGIECEYGNLPYKSCIRPIGKEANDVLSLKIAELGLSLGHLFIPDIYKFSSIEQRIALVQGMMDQRGHILEKTNKNSSMEAYISKTPSLTKDFKEVLSSLGLLPTSLIRKAKNARRDWPHTIFKAWFPCFRLSKMIAHVKPINTRMKYHFNIVTSVEEIPSQSIPMRCITVNSPDSIYLVSKQYTPTHNTWLAINELIKRAWSCPLPQGGKFIYIAPEKLQAKKIAWRELKYFLKNVPHTANETNLIITLPNGSTIELEGADNPDRIRGQHPHFVVLDEVAQMPRDTWYEAVFPALRAHNGGALFIGTPKGDNLFKDLFDQAHSKSSWFAIKKTIYDTNVATRDQIKEIRESMPVNKFEQEYLCSFTAAIQGTYFSNIINETPNLITDVPYNPLCPVITAWDLGTSDSTCIWFVQRDPHNPSIINIIDFEEDNNKDIHHYINLVNSKPYSYDHHILPHDVTHVSWESNRSRLSIFKSHTMKVIIAKKVPIIEGISMAQTLLYTSRFDQFKCNLGLNHLMNYRASTNRQSGEFNDTPLHDSHSNAADAFRTLAVGLKTTVNENNHPHNAYCVSQYDYMNPEQSPFVNHEYDLFNF